MDDVPDIQLSRGPHGSQTNPHVVHSPTALFCDDCGAALAPMLTERLVVALQPTEEPHG